MGSKSGRTGKYILYYFALSCIIVVLNIVSCAPVQDRIVEYRAHRQLEQYRENLADGFFETVIQHGQRVIENNETEPPADVALYALGEVYANPAYEGRDYEQSKYYFDKLVANFPDSTLSSEAMTYLSLFATIETKEKEKIEQKVQIKKQETVSKEKGEKEPSVETPRRVVENKNFDEAVKKNEQVLREVGPKKPADEALYNLGLIYAHVDNPAKDYKKSQIYFHVLTKQFPESEYAEEARIWLGLFETIEKIQQIDIDIEQQKKQLTR